MRCIRTCGLRLRISRRPPSLPIVGGNNGSPILVGILCKFFFANRNGRYQQLLLECKCTFFSISYASTRKKSMNRIKRHFKTECCNIHQPANNLFRLNQMHKTNDENSFETFFCKQRAKYRIWELLTRRMILMSRTLELHAFFNN